MKSVKNKKTLIGWIKQDFKIDWETINTKFGVSKELWMSEVYKHKNAFHTPDNALKVRVTIEEIEED